MKKILITALVIVLNTITTVAQTTEIIPFGDDNKMVYVSLEAMPDSTSDYFTSPIDISDYHRRAPSDNPYTAALKTYSADGSCNVYVILQGRMALGKKSDWVDLDTLGTYQTETLQFDTTTLNTKKPTQVRIKIEGATGNRSDSVIDVWFMLDKE